MNEELYEFLNQKMNTTNRSLALLNQECGVLSYRINKLNEFLSSPDKIEPGVLTKIFNKQVTGSSKFVLAIKFIGLYETYGNESQILSSKAYLTKILSNKISHLIETHSRFMQQTKIIEQEKQETLEYLHVLEKHNNGETLSKTDIEKLHSLIKQYGINDKTIDFFISATQNKTELKIVKKHAESEKEPEKSENQTKKESKTDTPKKQKISYKDVLKERKKEQQQIKSKTNKRQELISLFEIIKEKDYCANELPELKDKLQYIFKDYVKKLEHMSDDDFNVLLFIISDKEGLDVADETVFQESVCINILFALRNNNFNKIESLVNKYIDSPYISKDDFFNLSGIPEAKTILKNAKNYLVTDVDYINILSNIEAFMKDGSDLDSALRAYGVTKEEYLKYIISNQYEHAAMYIRRANLSEENKKELFTVLKTLVKTIKELEKLKKLEKEKSNKKEHIEERIKEKVSQNNYLVFLDRDVFESNLNEIIKNHPDMDYNQITHCISNIMTKNPDVLKRNRNIHMRYGKFNPYGILEERSGKIKIGFKCIDNVNVNGKPVYLILMMSFENVGLEKNIAFFEEQIKDYAKIIKAFEKENDSDALKNEAEDYIQEFRDFLNGLEEKKAEYINSNGKGGNTK